MQAILAVFAELVIASCAEQVTSCLALHDVYAWLRIPDRRRLSDLRVAPVGLYIPRLGASH